VERGAGTRDPALCCVFGQSVESLLQVALTLDSRMQTRAGALGVLAGHLTEGVSVTSR
jgi:hypothetical protein